MTEKRSNQSCNNYIFVHVLFSFFFFHWCALYSHHKLNTQPLLWLLLLLFFFVSYSTLVSTYAINAHVSVEKYYFYYLFISFYFIRFCVFIIVYKIRVHNHKRWKIMNNVKLNNKKKKINEYSTTNKWIMRFFLTLNE